MTTWGVALEDQNFDKAQRQLIKLTPTEQANLLKETRKRYRNLNDVPIFFRVALNDVNSWLELFDETTKAARIGHPMLLQYRPFIEKMPSSIKELLLSKIAEKYSNAKKMQDSPWNRNDALLFPKRLLDAWVRVLLPGDVIFKAIYEKTKDPIKSYQAYLDVINRYIVSKMPVNSLNYGNISAEDVLAFAERTQIFLKEFNEKLVKRGSSPSKNSRVLFYGSVIKGFGKNGSDLDSLFDEVAKSDFDTNMAKWELYRNLSDVAKSRNLKIDLDFKDEAAHNFVRGSFLSLTDLEPFFVEVTPDEINFLIVNSPQKDDDGLVAKGPTTFEKIPIR
jgi:hypothetical protein